MMAARALFPLACALMLAACGDDTATVDYVPDPDATPDAPARTDCDEVDFQGAPLQGPGFVDGAYAGPTDGPLVASSTVIYLLDTAEAGARFEALMVDISAELMRSDGLLGLALGGSPSCGAYRTLALWRDLDAMLAFVGSEAHVRAIVETGDIADRGTRTVHWTFDPTAEQLDWPTGVARASGADPLADPGGD